MIECFIEFLKTLPLAPHLRGRGVVTPSGGLYKYLIYNLSS